MSVGNADQVLRYKGFDVEIKNSSGGEGERDSSWTSVAGGALATEMVEATTGNDGERRFRPGAPFITPLVLRRPITDRKRRALIDWLNETAAGNDVRRRVTIVAFDENGKPVRTDIYEGCSIKEHCPPRLSAGSAEPIEEVVVLKATRFTTA